MPRLAALPTLSPARLDLDVYRGDTLSLRVVCRARGIPINITDYAFEAQIRPTIGGPVVATFDIYEVAPIVGELRLLLTPDQSQALTENSVWDLQSQDSVGRVRTLVRGNITSPLDVTRPNESRRSRRG